MSSNGINQNYRAVMSASDPNAPPHRSYYYAMGMTEEEINQPLVGVVSTWNEAAPCNITLDRQAQAAKKASPT